MILFRSKLLWVFITIMMLWTGQGMAAAPLVFNYPPLASDDFIINGFGVTNISGICTVTYFGDMRAQCKNNKEVSYELNGRYNFNWQDDKSLYYQYSANEVKVVDIVSSYGVAYPINLTLSGMGGTIRGLYCNYCQNNALTPGLGSGAGCTRTGSSNALYWNASSWRQNSQSGCTSRTRNTNGNASYLGANWLIDTLSILIRPSFVGANPLLIPSGTYTATLSLREGTDFLMSGEINPTFSNGSGAMSNIPIVVNVNHALNVSFPSNTVSLEPQQGWKRALLFPESVNLLQGALPFNLSASGLVSVYIGGCTYTVGTTCAVRTNNNGNEHTVPVDIALTVPNASLINANGQVGSPDFNKVLLGAGKSSEVVFTSLSVPLQNSRANLSFSVTGINAQDVVRNQGAHYSGTADITFERVIN